jgi:hypothetical protein
MQVQSKRGPLLLTIAEIELTARKPTGEAGIAISFEERPSVESLKQAFPVVTMIFAEFK